MREQPDTMWVAVRVQRGFITEVKAYAAKSSARRREQGWRAKMNPDYDETEVLEVRLLGKSGRSK